MYIARKGQIVEEKEMTIKFYVLDEDNEYRLVKGHALSFPLGTPVDVIDDAIAQVVKDSYESQKGASPLSLAEIKTAAVQDIGKEVKLTQEKLHDGNN